MRQEEVKVNKLLLFLLIILVPVLVYSQPTGVIVQFNETETPTAAPAAELTTAGGTFTTLVLEGTFQNPRWKAYVGNVTGSLTLSDSTQNTIYDWALTVVSGSVFVSRNDSIVWSGVSCASPTTIADEENFLNMTASSPDSISNTFNDTIHRGFFVGTVEIPESTCNSIATYVNNQQQTLSTTSAFQEVLLEDTNDNLVFTTMLEDSVTGFDGSLFDFQLIVPEDSTSVTPTTYYFFVEIT